MKNIELKVRADLSSLSARLNSLNPSHVGTVFQKDTYYLLGSRRLKIREEEDAAEIIYYERDDEENSKDSRYFIVKIRKAWFQFAKLTLSFLFCEKKVVEKERDLYIYENTRIHLDKVKDLGEFLELETVVRHENRYDEYRKEQSKVINILRLQKYQKLAASYSDMLVKQT